MSDLRVRVVGGLEIDGVDSATLGSRKARTLIAILALARSRPVPTDRLTDALWPTRPPARPAEQVSVLVSRCRAALGADRIRRSPSGYTLAVDWLDLDAIAELVEEAERRLATDATTAARVAAGAALALARGPLLPEEPDADWAEADRALAQRLLAHARSAAAKAALLSGDSVDATELASKTLDYDPFDEDALRVLMAAHVHAGRPASALAAYARVRERLVEELGTSPAPETEELHLAILQERPLPGAGAHETHRLLTLQGRDGEVAVLDAAASVGDGSMVVIDGEAGIGKTRLLEVWAANLRARGTIVLFGRCEELTRGLPLQAVIDAIEGHLRAAGTDAVDGILGAERNDLGPFFGRVGAAPTGSIDQPTGQLLVFRGLLQVLRRLAEKRPVVLIIDDLHLAGPLTTEWLHFASRHATGVSLALVAAVRPEEATTMPGASVVHLGPLDMAATRALVGDTRAAELHDRSGGHPLFLVELAASDSGEHLPASITDAVGASAARAGADAATTLRSAAVLGADIDLDLVSATLGASPVALLAHLEEGVRRHLLVEQGETFAFRHALVRDALVEGTSASRRALLHREAGRVLAARSDADPLLVAHHARLGGDTELAARQLVLAAAVASARFDQVEATRLISESIGLEETAEARVLQGRIALLAERHAEAADHAARAYDLGGGAEAREVGAWAAHYRRDPDLAIRLADEGAELATTDDQRAACLTVAGWVRDTLGELDDAEANLREARHVGRGPVRSMASAWLGGLLVHRSRVDEGIRLLDEPQSGGHRLWGHPSLHALLFGALGYGTAGRAAEALVALDRLEAEIDRLGARRWAGRVDNCRGWIMRNVGAPEEADEHNVQALEAAAAVNMLEPLCHGYLDLASGALLRGDTARAAELVELAHDPTHPWHAMQWRHHLRAELLRGRIALDGGDATAAREAAHSVHAAAATAHVTRYVVFAHLLDAEARLTVGDTVDIDEIGRLLETLPAVAGLEAWSLTSVLARRTGVDAFHRLAERRVSELVARAGIYGETLAAHARLRLA